MKNTRWADRYPWRRWNIYWHIREFVYWNRPVSRRHMAKCISDAIATTRAEEREKCAMRVAFALKLAAQPKEESRG